MFVPAMAQFPAEIAMTSLTFPLCNVNNETTSFLKRSDSNAPANCYCGVFALDPFANWDELARKILDAKFRGICNFPSLPEFDDEETRALASSGYSYETEIAKMRDLSRFGLELLIFYKSDAQHALAKDILMGVDAEYLHYEALNGPSAGEGVSASA